MRAAKIALVVVAVIIGLVGALAGVAVVREPGPSTGDALTSSPQGIAYAAAQSKALAAAGLKATDRVLELKSPQMRVHAYEFGAGGDPIVFIHGGGSTAAVWIPLLAELGGRHMVSVDRPGCGLTDGVDYSKTDLHTHAVAFVGGVLDALGLQRAVLVGNSMGGLFSMWFALEHPERVSGIVFPGTPAIVLDTSAPKPLRMMSIPGLGQLMTMKNPDLAGLKMRMTSSLGQHAVERASPELLDTALHGVQLPGSGMSHRTLVASVLLRSGSGPKPGVAPTAAQIGRLAPPTLWIWGDADTFADANFPSRVRAALPSAELVVLPGSGHAPWLDDVKAVAQAMTPFLDRLAQPAAAAH